MSNISKKVQERRRHKRNDMKCAVSFFGRDGSRVGGGETINLSDGGAFVVVPLKTLTNLSSKVSLVFSVPRSTPNTYMVEEFASPALILRHQPLTDEARAGVAIRFDRPIELGLEV